MKHFSIAASGAISICALVYTGAATFGYLTFGSHVHEDILTNYSASKPTVMIALVAMAAKTYTTYPILLFCGREGINSLVKDLFIREDTETKEKVRRVGIASLWFGLSLVLAIEMPDIGAVINLLGSLAAVFIFVFPGLCLLRTAVMKDPMMATSRARWKIFGAFLFLLMGAFLFGVVFTQALIFNMSGSSREIPLCTTKQNATPEIPTLYGHIRLLMKF